MPGRFGSGRRRNPARAKQRVEDCALVVDVCDLLPNGEVIDGPGVARAGVHSIAFRVVGGDEPSIELAFAVRSGDKTVTRRQTIALAPSWEPFSKFGPWFACPACARRVTKIYMPSPERPFACRRCSGLTYTSSQVHDDRIGKLRRDPVRVVAILSGEEIATETVYMLALKAAGGSRGAEPIRSPHPQSSQSGQAW